MGLETGLEERLDEVVRTKVFAFGRILAHPVGKFVNMPASLENSLRRNDGTIQLHHVLLDDEMVPPFVNDVALQGAAGRTVVEEAAVVTLEVRRRSIDAKCLGKEEATLQEGLEFGATKSHPFEIRRVGHMTRGRLRR